MSAKRDIRQMVRKLKRQGWIARIAGSGHWHLTNPDGESMTCSYSPRSDNAYTRAAKDARKLGAEL